MSMGREPDPPRTVPEWLVTFSDVMSLLLTFFVMMLTFSSKDKEKFDKASGSLRGAMGVMVPNIARLPQAGMIESRLFLQGRTSSAGMDFPPEFEPLAYEVSEINMRLKNEKSGLSVQVIALSRGVLIRTPASLLFLSHTAQFAPGAEEHLARIATTLSGLRHEIEIMAHVGTDSPGGQNAAWARTNERAARVAEFFVKAGSIDPARLSTGGKGNTHTIGRQPSALDDRVDITLLKAAK